MLLTKLKTFESLKITKKVLKHIFPNKLHFSLDKTRWTFKKLTENSKKFKNLLVIFQKTTKTNLIFGRTSFTFNYCFHSSRHRLN